MDLKILVIIISLIVIVSLVLLFIFNDPSVASPDNPISTIMYDNPIGPMREGK